MDRRLDGILRHTVHLFGAYALGIGLVGLVCVVIIALYAMAAYLIYLPPELLLGLGGMLLGALAMYLSIRMERVMTLVTSIVSLMVRFDLREK